MIGRDLVKKSLTVSNTELSEVQILCDAQNAVNFLYDPQV